MAFDRQQLYIELTRRRNNAYSGICTHFLFEKDNKVPSWEDADKRTATQRRSTAVARAAQRSTRLEITLQRTQPPARAAPAPPTLRDPLCIVSQRASQYTFVTRRRLLSRDLGAEMLLIMRPDKPALCRVLSVIRIFHERRAQRNRYMPPRLSPCLDDVRLIPFNLGFKVCIV